MNLSTAFGLLVFSACLASSSGAAGMPPEERCARRWLNEHVIAVNNQGLAIEPYDYVSGHTVSLGIVHLHSGTSTRLQIGRLNPKYDAALASTGLDDLPNLPGKNSDALLFRDVLVPHSLLGIEHREFIRRAPLRHPQWDRCLGRQSGVGEPHHPDLSGDRRGHVRRAAPAHARGSHADPALRERVGSGEIWRRAGRSRAAARTAEGRRRHLLATRGRRTRCHPARDRPLQQKQRA